jgi:hypothetical protein
MARVTRKMALLPGKEGENKIEFILSSYDVQLVHGNRS